MLWCQWACDTPSDGIAGADSAAFECTPSLRLAVRRILRALTTRSAGAFRRSRSMLKGSQTLASDEPLDLRGRTSGESRVPHPFARCFPVRRMGNHEHKPTGNTAVSFALHSVRNARAGSSRDALHAGTAQAKDATRESSSATSAKIGQLNGLVL